MLNEIHFLTLSFIHVEKNGKMLHLLKAKSKPVPSIKKRNKIQLLGTYQAYQESKKKPAPASN